MANIAGSKTNAIDHAGAVSYFTFMAILPILTLPDPILRKVSEPVERVVDTTGAGDLYAAGFLYGLTNGHTLAESGRIGAIAAGEIIGHMGARSETPLADLVKLKLR